jgi:putative PIN family toxin of toxin-antitoxin system
VRFVLDTNVVLSSLFWNGPPREILGFALRERYQRFTSAPLLHELTDVLSRKKFASRISLSPLSIDQLVDRYAQSAALVIPRLTQRVAPDPDDDVVIGTALAAKANFIVTGDRPLLSVSAYQSVRIISAREALRLLNR